MKKFGVYISGPIAGVDDYQKPFEEAEKKLTEAGFAVFNPAKLPEGLTKEQYMRINFAQIEAADAVLLLPGWEKSKGAKLESAYCDYIGKNTCKSIDLLIHAKDFADHVTKTVKGVFGI